MFTGDESSTVMRSGTEAVSELSGNSVSDARVHGDIVETLLPAVVAGAQLGQQVTTKPGGIGVGIDEAPSPNVVETRGGEQTHQIVDGVRRSKATEIAAQQGVGTGRISAQVVEGGRITGTIEVDAASLLSPKSSISTAGSGLDRWLNTLRRTLGGSKPPPILVQPGSTGTPIKNVLIE